MATLPIESLRHWCVVPSGPLAGNKHSHDITSGDIEYELHCDVCGEKYVEDLRPVLAHIYEQLTNH